MNFNTNSPISLISWNVQGIALSRNSRQHTYNSEKFTTLKNYNVCSADIIALQELHMTKHSLIKYASYSLPGKKAFFSSSDKNVESIAIYINEKFSIIDVTEIIPGRILKITFIHPISNNRVSIYNVYNYPCSKSKDSTDLLITLEKDLSRSNLPTLLLGDFNIDVYKLSKLSEFFSKFIENNNLTDLGKLFVNEANTWRGDGKRAFSQSRLDYIFAKNFFIPSHQKFHVLVVPTSDHAMISLEVRKSPNNNSSPHKFSHIKEHLLSDPSFNENFTQKLLLLLKNNFLFHSLKDHKLREDFLNIDESKPDKLAFWILDDPDCYDSENFMALFNDILKLVADETFLLYKRRKSHRNKAFRKFRNTCYKFYKDPSDTKLNNFLNAKNALKEQIQKSTKLISDKKRLNFLKKTSSKANDFYKLLGKNTCRAVPRLLDPISGAITADTERIVQIFSDNFEAKTFDSSNQSNLPTFTFPSSLKTLLQKYNTSLNDIFPQFPGSTSHAPFSLQETMQVLKKTKINSAPGPSKISRHTLLFICKYIPNIFVHFINSLIFHVNLSNDPLTKWILDRDVIFIKKKSNDPSDPNNFRPISLLESIYKLISKLTISRFESKIFESLSDKQYGFRKSRQMSLASITINQIISALNSFKKSAALVSIDIKAAFDSAKHTTINAILTHIFPDNPLIQKMALFYHNARARVNMGGYMGREIHMSKGTGQGDPSSTFRYLLLHHLFNFFLEKFAEIEKVSILMSDLCASLPVLPHPNIAFADDTLQIFNTSLSPKIAEKLLLLYKDLTVLTGLVINTKKSNYLLLGNSIPPNFIQALDMLASSKKSFEHLGVQISPDPEHAGAETFDLMESSMRKKANLMISTMSNIDIFTKMLITRAIIIARPIHVFRVYPPSTQTLDNMWDIIKSSLWKKSFQNKTVKRIKVASTRLCIPVHDGGLQMIHIKTTAALSLLSSFISIIRYSVADKNSLMAAILHNNIEQHDTAIKFFNFHFFCTFWAPKMKLFFPGSNHLIAHIKELVMKLELDSIYGLFMPVLNHQCLNPKVKFLNIFKSSDFDPEAPLEAFPNIISLMKVIKIGRKVIINPLEHNPKIDLLTNETQKKHLKLLLKSTQKKARFHLSKFAISNRKLTFFELTAKYSPKTLLNALKKMYYQINSQNNPPPPSWTSRKKEKLYIPPSLEHFRNSFKLALHSKLPPSLRSFHYDYLSRVCPSLTKLQQFKSNDIKSSICPRPECANRELVADSQHIVFDCIFASTILYTINKTRLSLNLDLRLDDMFYLFPQQDRKHKSFLEMFVLATQIKIAAFGYVIDEKFHKWSYQHFFVKYISILKTSILICELYDIPIKLLHALKSYGEENGCGIICQYMHDF